MIADRATGAGAVSTGIVELEPGSRVPLHYHLVEEAIMVVAGQGEAVLANDVVPVDAGMTVLAPAGTPHSLRNTGDSVLRLVIAYPAVEVEAFPVPE
jgi:quercetin dioxygenase-like cupin family protein